MDLNSASSMRTSVRSSKQASRRYAFFFPIILGGSKFTWKEVVELRMPMFGRPEVVVGRDNIMFSHGRHMFHLVSNPSLILDKHSVGLGLNLGYSFVPTLARTAVRDKLTSNSKEFKSHTVCSHPRCGALLGPVKREHPSSRERRLGWEKCVAGRLGCLFEP